MIQEILVMKTLLKHVVTKDPTSDPEIIIEGEADDQVIIFHSLVVWTYHQELHLFTESASYCNSFFFLFEFKVALIWVIVAIVAYRSTFFVAVFTLSYS
jgi:hypothetical protein